MTHARSLGGTLLAIAATVLLSPSPCSPQSSPQDSDPHLSVRSFLPRGALSGERTGTKHYLVQLRTRSFRPQDLLNQIRVQPDRATRRTMLSSLPQIAADDHADVRALAEGAGGRWLQSFWFANVCALELDENGRMTIERYSRVLGVWPLEARGPSDLDSAPAPIGDSVGSVLHAANDAKNSNIIPTVDQSRINGAGITIGFFDSGLDVDAHPTGLPHPCFGTPGSGSRLLGSFLIPGTISGVCPQTIQAIDTNTTNPPVHPFTLQYSGGGWTMATHRDARHGTSVAAIALG